MAFVLLNMKLIRNIGQKVFKSLANVQCRQLSRLSYTKAR